MLVKPPGKRPQILFASIPSPRTLHADLLRLCARIGYSPPVLL